MHPASKFTKAKSVMDIPRNKFIWPVRGQGFQLESKFSRDLKGKYMPNEWLHTRQHQALDTVSSQN